MQAKAVSPESLQQVAVISATRVKNKGPEAVEMKGGEGSPAVVVKVGSGLEKTAQAAAIYSP